MSQNHRNSLHESKPPVNSVAIDSSVCVSSPEPPCVEARENLRKPPFRLPPLDPSIFEKKSKTSKRGGSSEKKKKLQKHKPIAIDSSTDPNPREERSHWVSKTENNYDTERDGGQDKWEEIAPSAYLNSPSLMNERKKWTDGRSSDESEFPASNLNPRHEKDEFRFRATKKTPPVIVNGNFLPRIPRPQTSRFNQIASSLEVLPSKKAIGRPLGSGSPKTPGCTHCTPQTESIKTPWFCSHVASPKEVTSAANTSVYCTETSRIRRRSRSLGDITSSVEMPHSQDSISQTDRSCRFDGKRRVPVRVQNAALYNCIIAANHSNREDNSPGRFPIKPLSSEPQQEVRFVDFVLQNEVFKSSDENPRVSRRVQTTSACKRDLTADLDLKRNENDPGSSQGSRTSPENGKLVGNEGGVFQSVGVARRRSSSQPDLRQSRQCEAPLRGRRVGVCRETEDAAFMNDRIKTRVFMKKFGELNNSS